MKHTNDECHLTQHARTGVPPTKFHQSTHIQGNNENLGNHRDHLEWTKFSPVQVRVKNSSLGQKLCKLYLNTYH